MATAFLKNYKQSPRKVRLVADTIRGKSIKDAQTVLSFMPKRAATPILKLLNSAVANAKETGEVLETLVVTEVSVQKGTVAHRWMPKWRGMAHPIKKRSSHVKIVLGESTKSSKKKKEVIESKPKPKKETEKAVKKVAPKKVTKKVKESKK